MAKFSPYSLANFANKPLNFSTLDASNGSVTVPVPALPSDRRAIHTSCDAGVCAGCASAVVAPPGADCPDDAEMTRLKDTRHATAKMNTPATQVRRFMTSPSRVHQRLGRERTTMC